MAAMTPEQLTKPDNRRAWKALPEVEFGWIKIAFIWMT
jgi:hypothetical protein